MNQHIVFRLLRILKRQLGIYLILTVGIAVTLTLRQIYLAWILKDFLDFAFAGRLRQLLITVGMGLLYVTLLGIIRPYFKFLSDRIVLRAMGDLKKDLYAKILKLPLEYYSREHSGDILSRLTNDMKDVETALTSRLTNLLSFSLCAISATVAMFFLDFWLALIALITAALALAANASFAQPLREISGNIQARLGVLTATLTDTLAGLNIIQAFNQYSAVNSKFAAHNQEIYQTSLKRVQLGASLAAMNDFGKMIDIIGVMGIGAFLSIHGKVSVGAIVAIWQLKTPLLTVFKEIGDIIAGLQTGLASAERVFAVLDETEEPQCYDQLKEEGVASPDLAIQMQDVVFGYRHEEHVLRKLTLSVPKGNKVAIVGPSGEGKSSVFKLILGFYPPEQGQILLEGESLARVPLVELRKKLAYVPQNAYLFSGSVKENIRYGRMDATDEEIVAAARLANAHEFICSFENGYETYVGERGAQISGGQRQRIGIARAILRNAPILLFDEATSALDAGSEQLVAEALDHLREGRTIVLITHRLSAIQDSDLIYVIEDGQVRESGTHAGLMAMSGGLYRMLYLQQYETLQEVS